MTASKYVTAVLVMVIAAIVVTSLPVSAQTGSPPGRGARSGVVGEGTWFLGDANLTCERDARPDSLEFIDRCTYKADSGSDADPEGGCLEFAFDTIVGGCRARLTGATKTTSHLPDVCVQGGLMDGKVQPPVGAPDGEVTIYSAALGKSYAVPVSINLQGTYARIFGTRRVDSARVGYIVVDGKFVWNLQGRAGCPVQGTEPASGVWQGHYTFFSDSV
jgi:hypothetical protein